MNTITYTHRNKPVELRFPGSWDELSPSQLLRIAKKWPLWIMALRHTSAGTGIAIINAAMLEQVIILSGINRWNWFSANTRNFLRLLPTRRQMRQFKRNPEFLEEFDYLPALLSISKFLFEKVDRTKNPFPILRGKNRLLHGPADSLMSICVKEFIFADSFFTSYKKTLGRDELDMLVSVLYRPGKQIKATDPGFTGDYRIPFNNMAIDEWMPDVKLLPMAEKTAIALFYEGCRSNFEKLYPKVFEKHEENPTTNNSQGWYSLLSELPADKFGTLTQREQVNIDVMFTELNYLLGKMEEKK
jgi:hypothetical protein